jgi:hypothetical protein
MNKTELHRLIKESMEEVLNETQNLDHLRDGIPPRPIIGEAWNRVIQNLETLIGEISEFNSTFGTTMGRMGIKEKLATRTYVAQLQQVAQILEQIYPAVKTMTNIERQDQSRN